MKNPTKTDRLKEAWRLRHEDPARLALQLQKQSGHTPEDRQFLIHQVKGRQAAAKKLPRWAANPDLVFPPAQNLEQSSSESTAAYKATLLADALFVHPSSHGISSHGTLLPGTSSHGISSHGTLLPGTSSHGTILPGHHPTKNGNPSNSSQSQGRSRKTLVDLTGGFGIDSAFFAKHFSHVIHVEPDAELQAIAEHNCHALGLSNVTFQNSTAEEWLHQAEKKISEILHDTEVEATFDAPFEATFDTLYIDPSRRPASDSSRPTSGPQRLTSGPQHQTRVSTLEDSLPNVLELLPRMCKLARNILIKASPMISIPETIRQLHEVLGSGQNTGQESVASPSGFLREVHIVSVQNECKEVLFRVDGRGMPGRSDGVGQSDGTGKSDRRIDDSSIPQEPRIFAVNLTSKETTDEAPQGSEFAFWPREEAEAGASVVYADPGSLFEWGKTGQGKEGDENVESNAGEYYLFEPNASIMKSGAFHLVATRYGLQKVAPNTHLYVCSARAGVIVENPGSTASNTERGSEDGQSIRVSDLPGRVMQIYRVLPYQQALLREVLQKELGIHQAQIATRNFPETEVQVRKKTGLKQAGHHAPAEHGWAGVHRLVACRLSNDRLAVFTGVSAGASEGAHTGASATQLKGQDSKK